MTVTDSGSKGTWVTIARCVDQRLEDALRHDLTRDTASCGPSTSRTPSTNPASRCRSTSSACECTVSSPMTSEQGPERAKSTNGSNYRPNPFKAQFIPRSETIRKTIEREGEQALADLAKCATRSLCICAAHVARRAQVQPPVEDEAERRDPADRVNRARLAGDRGSGAGVGCTHWRFSSCNTLHAYCRHEGRPADREGLPLGGRGW